MRFKVIIPTYNAMPWLERCLESVASQTLEQLDVHIIDDASTDPTQPELIKRFASENGWTTTFNTTNRKALYNIVHGIATSQCEDDDIVTVIDGDDWLYNEHVLERLYQLYQEKELLLTYGSFINYKTAYIGCTKAVNPWVRWRRSYRRQRWAFSHLRTFKYRLFRQIHDVDLKDSTGQYFEVAWDQALMFPMLEMAGSKIYHCPFITYVYNDSNPISDCKIKLKEQLAVERYIRSLPKYQLMQ